MGEHGNTAVEEAQRILAKAARKRSSLMEAIPPQEQGNTEEEEAQRILAKAARNKSSWMEEALYTDWDDGWSVQESEQIRVGGVDGEGLDAGPASEDRAAPALDALAEEAKKAKK